MNIDAPKKPRLRSLDGLRGLTIMLMILVNNPGSWGHVYGPFLHAPWHGCTLTDLVFPFFLFIVGSAMYFSFSRLESKPASTVVFKILTRTILIFAIGLALNWLSAYTWSKDLRIMGVLQRIAIAYALAAVVLLFTRRRELVLTIAAGAILVYWALLLVFGGESPFSVEHNAVRKLDMMILGAKRLYSVDGIPFDPEGLLSTLPSIASVLFGYEATRYLKSETKPGRGVLILAAAGVLAIALGWAWGFIWPVNKALWTGSFVVLTTGFALVALAVFVWLMDIVGFEFNLLQAFGMNPLFLYVASWVWMTSYHLIKVGDQSLFSIVHGFFLAGDTPSKASSFLFAASHIALFAVFAIILYRKKIVIKV